jgi:hypothetical protein
METENSSGAAPIKAAKKIIKKKVTIIVLVVLVLAAAAFIVVRRQSVNWNDDKLTTAEQKILITKIGNLIALPDEAQPVFALVTDAEKLRTEQAFYANVQNGDILLVLPTTRKAIIYSPSADKLVNVGPFVVNQAQ